MKGEAVYLYAYDAAHEIDTERARGLLTDDAGYSRPQSAKPAPKDYPFYKPLLVPYAPLALRTALGEVSVRREVKVFSVGAVSVTLRIPFEVGRAADLLPYHEPKLADGRALDAIADELCAKTVASIRDALVKPVPERGAPEAYVVFCVEGLGLPPRDWLETSRKEAAGLLIGEPDYPRLSDSEAKEALRLSLAYDDGDLFLVDWNSAVVVEPERNWEELLYVVEMANLQLSQLRIHDAALSKFLDQAYDDLEAYARSRRLLSSPRSLLARFREMLVDVTKMAEELTNITKFLGDWHLARAYLACSERFHLKEWEASVEQKLDRLDKLYRRVLSEQQERRMLVLELMIVALFVLDILLLLWEMGRGTA